MHRNHKTEFQNSQTPTPYIHSLILQEKKVWDEQDLANKLIIMVMGPDARPR